MPKLSNGFKKLFGSFPELTRLENSFKYTQGQQNLLASDDRTFSGIRSMDVKWRKILAENGNLKDELEEFILREIIFEEWRKMDDIPDLSYLNNLMYDAGCPSFHTLIYRKGFKLFKGSYKVMTDELVLKFKKKLTIKKSLKKAPE